MIPSFIPIVNIDISEYSEIQTDKTMAYELIYIPNGDTQNYTYCKIKVAVETFGHST